MQIFNCIKHTFKNKVTADVDLNSESSAESWDYRFVKWMIVNKKLATIPTTAFYSEEHKSLSSKFIRFCFCKVISFCFNFNNSHFVSFFEN